VSEGPALGRTSAVFRALPSGSAPAPAAHFTICAMVTGFHGLTYRVGHANILMQGGDHAVIVIAARKRAKHQRLGC
jgi:hypothetical protein